MVSIVAILLRSRKKTKAFYVSLSCTEWLQVQCNPLLSAPSTTSIRIIRSRRPPIGWLCRRFCPLFIDRPADISHTFISKWHWANSATDDCTKLMAKLCNISFVLAEIQLVAVNEFTTVDENLLCAVDAVQNNAYFPPYILVYRDYVCVIFFSFSLVGEWNKNKLIMT